MFVTATFALDCTLIFDFCLTLVLGSSCLISCSISFLFLVFALLYTLFQLFQPLYLTHLSCSYPEVLLLLHLSLVIESCLLYMRCHFENVVG